MSDKHPSAIVRISKSLFQLLNVSRKIIVNVVFFLVLFIFVIIFTNDEAEIIVPSKAALVLNIEGDVVEQKVEIDPLDAFLAEATDQPNDRPEVLLQDVLDAISIAKEDDRIQMIVLKLAKMSSANITKARMIAKYLQDFKTSGKKVIAVGDQFTQDQYYLASYADEIWMNPNGWLLLDGYGRYQTYVKSAFDKLAISQHIFRVGTYKSAVEPFIRDDMSQEAKEANRLWLSQLWAQYKTDVAAQREFSIDNFDESIDILLDKLEKADGKIAQYALNNHWVDQLKTHDQINETLLAMVGRNTQGNFNQIGFNQYLRASTPMVAVGGNADKVAVIVAKGTILDGEQPPGTIGGDTLAKYLKQARLNHHVKAVVLRVDSPGGSAFASDVIRHEIDLLKQAGKTVVASMGSYAASGGYWISAPADAIVASPTTITGSIGIFGFFMTFEKSLEKLGIFTDGVGTTDLAGFSIARPLNDKVAKVFQLGIERGYQDFIALVAKHRNMSLQEVDKIAQGRVWSGLQAQQLGLVDALGDLDDAISLAAELANLTNYETMLIEKVRSTEELFWQNIFTETSAFLPTRTKQTPDQLHILLNHVKQELTAVSTLNDPQGIYAKCIACELN
ncbi:signal peptide peptidase SppA [Thalassotalea sp. 1_MG-2023]|uniref:signal peptide peptidase SppA n=1 Tax=Thalassotalea sp. 1_MG-2023 TaxID=3062680 RepID=UPI0026E34462|nr:signal peptide peptidase SppA [Thalassotalea sp. 1_MG-2023]MDO6428735.1 signal peptide peptidase SppA [Thalassotalea sp. 1_MG-2023]